MSRWVILVAIVMAVATRLIFWLLTDRTWEDALITLAHVRNAAEGFGLTHHVGEPPTHGFTSAASVLIPLPAEILWAGSGLTAIRIASLAASGATMLLGLDIARHLRLSTWPTVLVLGYLAFDQLHVFFGMAGMETQVAVAVLLAGILAVIRERPLLAGLLGGAAVLTRPDLGLWLVPVLVWAWRRGRRDRLLAIAGAAAVVGPWLAFTTAYYGSPIPQTIVAKSLAFTVLPESVLDLGAWIGWLGQQVATSALAMLRAFMPFFEDGTLIAAPIPAGMLSLVGLGMLALIGHGALGTRRVPEWWPVLAYAALFLALWLAVLPPVGYFAWYLPPFTAVAVLLAAAGLERLRSRRPRMVSVTAAFLAIAFAIHLPWSTPLEARVQADVDDGIRRQVGRYLGEVVEPGDGVVAEPAGYLGYYSRATIYDYPGLTSRISLAAVRSMPRSERSAAGLMAAVEPPWAVLRPEEWAQLERDLPHVAACYTVDREFGVVRDSLIGLNGLWKWNQDWSFTVYHRTGCMR